MALVCTHIVLVSCVSGAGTVCMSHVQWGGGGGGWVCVNTVSPDTGLRRRVAEIENSNVLRAIQRQLLKGQRYRVCVCVYGVCVSMCMVCV